MKPFSVARSFCLVIAVLLYTALGHAKNVSVDVNGLRLGESVSIVVSKLRAMGAEVSDLDPAGSPGGTRTRLFCFSSSDGKVSGNFRCDAALPDRPLMSVSFDSPWRLQVNGKVITRKGDSQEAASSSLKQAGFTTVMDGTKVSAKLGTCVVELHWATAGIENITLSKAVLQTAR